MSEYNKRLEGLIDTVIKEGASDLHLSVGRPPTIRVSGNLLPLVREDVLTPEASQGLTLALLSPETKEAFLANKDMDFAYSAKDGTRFRGNAFYQKGYVGATLRAIPEHLKSFEELNLPTALQEFCHRPQGFFLVVGPVGQGKSTTLAAMIELVNRERATHIITIEDPIEYIFTADKSIIDQREVRFDTKDFHTALRSMFRQDVNVALIGEMRDYETVGTAVTAAETGHLVFSTLHTNNAAQTIDRIIDSFPAEQQDQIRIQLAGSLLGIFSQRLVPRISGGLIPAYELLVNTPAVSNLIRESHTSEINVMIETGSENGMIDMNHSLSELIRKGEITLENAYQHSFNPRGLERLV